MRLPTNQNVLISDTVGFIRKLPHQLVEAFKATLEEVVEADLLIHVVDASHPQVTEQIESVNQVLAEIGANDKPTLMVFNKIDRLNGEPVPARMHESYPHAVAISALTRDGFDALQAELGALLRPTRDLVSVRIPFSDTHVIARLHEVGQVVERKYNGKHARFRVRIPPQSRREFAPYIVE